MDLQLEKKRALVTGSTAGIGLAIAESLLKEGAHVVVNGRSQIRVDEAINSLQKITGNDQITGVVADFGKAGEVNALLEAIPEVDLLINNVGIFEPKGFDQITDEDWYRLFEINVMSGIRLCRHYFPRMITQDWGRIIFISSESGVQIPAEMIHYGMTKTAQIAVAGGLARLTRGTKVTVNSVLPGSTMSEGAANFIQDLAQSQNKSRALIEQEFFEEVRPSSLLKRFATTGEVANLVTYLCSPLSSATNGAALRVDGGTIPTII